MAGSTLQAGSGGSDSGSRRISLCVFSRSEILHDHILHSCPIQLTKADCEHCPCRRRVLHRLRNGQDLRVLSCTWPMTWDGKEIANPQGFIRWAQRRCQEKRLAGR